MLKKILISVGLLTMVISAYQFECHYTRKDCVVTAKVEDGIIITDKCGFTWFAKTDEFIVDDVVNLKMHTNHTNDNIEDDEILKIIKK